MEGWRRRSGEAIGDQAVEGGDDEKQGDKGETDVEGNRVCENVPVQRREDGGEPSEVVLAMEDLAGGEGGVGEGVVDQDLQRKHFFR